MIFGCQSSIIQTSVDIHIDIKAGISIQGHSAMDIRKEQISMSGYPFVKRKITMGSSLGVVWTYLQFRKKSGK